LSESEKRSHYLEANGPGEKKIQKVVAIQGVVK